MITNAYAFELKAAFGPAGKFTDLGHVMTNFIAVLVSVAVILSIIYVIIGGIKTITASGDPKKLAEARMVIFYAIIGLSVSILSLVIIQVVQYFLKSSVAIT